MQSRQFLRILWVILGFWVNQISTNFQISKKPMKKNKKPTYLIYCNSRLTVKTAPNYNYYEKKLEN